MSSLYNNTYSKNRDFPWQTIDGETIIIDPRGHASYELNDVGSFIWGYCDGTHSLQAIEELLCHEYDVTPETARRDLLEVAVQLLSDNLLIECAQ